MLTHLGPNSKILYDPMFEQGLCKIIDGREQSLSAAEKRAVKILLCETVEIGVEGDEEGLSYFEKLEQKRRRVSKKYSTIH